MMQTRLAFFLAFALLAPAHAIAQQLARPAASDPVADDTLVAGGFLEGHPDLRYRNTGLEAYSRKAFSEAIEQFKRAAWYADKPSQAVVGEMYWDGMGVAQDRALGLVWMDLAAERGYDFFSRKRDYYWNTLSEAERKRALAAAREIHREYADEAAEPRLAAALRRERSKMTGSRVGSMSSSVQIIVPGYGSIDGSRFYDPQFWDPKQYRQWQDTYWVNLKVGQVTVGEVEQVETGAKPEAAKPAPRNGQDQP